MSAYRAALLALFVVAGALVAAVPASGTPLGSDADGTSATDALSQSDERVRATGPTPMASQNSSRNNSSLGADISSFMQSSAAEVGGAVETGMWTAAYNSTDNETVRVRLVERQTADLRDELGELKERKAELVGDRNATNVSDAAYKAKLGHLVGRINALKVAINATAVRARETNTNVAAVAALQSETDNLTGPEIAAVARNTTGVGVGVGKNDGQGGPPSDVGNGNANGSGNGNGNGDANENSKTNGNSNAKGVAGEANETTGPPNGVGNNGAGNDSSNASQQGPPVRTNAPMAGNGTDATSGDEVLSLAAGTANDLVGPMSDAVSPVSDALAVRTYAFSHAPGSP